MDGKRFDQFVRLRALGANRRTVIASLLGAVPAAALRSAGAQECTSLSGECSALACCAPYRCCSDTCVDFSSDDLNCGECGIGCSLSDFCDSGTCTVLCEGALVLCGTDCVDLDSDSGNCGDCEITCTEGDVCCGGVCTNTGYDDTNCGQCGTVCNEGEICDDGSCVPASQCQSGATDCDGSCVYLGSDENNCGDCSIVCAAGEVCSGGNCVEDTDGCAGDLVACGSACVDTSTDAGNCGSCGNACGGGACCGGVCADLTADAANCGACGSVCPGDAPICADSLCLTGICEIVEDGLDTVYQSSVVGPDGLALATKTISRELDNGAYDGYWTRTRVTRGEELVLEYRYDFRVSETWTIIVEYGPDFGGVAKATYKGAKGELISGDIDGRPIAPFSPRNPGAAIDWLEPIKNEPELGAAPDPALADALVRLFEQASQEALACEIHLQLQFSPVGDAGDEEETSATSSLAGVRAYRLQSGVCDAGMPQTPSLGSAGCIACRAACMTAGATCGYSAAITCPSLAAACLIGYPACLGACLAVSLTACALTQYACQVACRAEGGPCCPVGCGNSCCSEGQTCLNPTIGLCCTSPGSTPCNGLCCCGPDDVCMGDGGCCPKDAEMCGDTCCAAGETCADGVCCAEVCDLVEPSQCCESMDTCTECGCCPPGTTCSLDLYGERICCADGQVCGDICCPNGESCEDPASGACLGADSCAEGEDACPGGLCCPRVTTEGGGEIDTCCGEVCCPEDAPYCCGEASDGGEPDCRAYNCIR